ncbi:glycoside hydrolase superfamily [Vararia minispora EC-137]|uniref:Glycoside hydrolase superfamily n=1 Tax=Vararia minispora EC-137 TaxID=1314806 RepID=A0ACB8Q767_9AGAM|nr:glycoside hydrolase superfamily [Vararia minispora EC-137]
MRFLQVLGAALAQAAIAYVVPQGSPGFYHGNSSSSVTFDAHTLFLDNKRLVVFSGEMHPWRSPSGVPTWRDVFQKLKASSHPWFNAVSVYHRWGSSEGKQGELDFEQWRNHSMVYQTAKEVGILVISRPGPYINAETSAGGYPGWTTSLNATTRLNDTLWTEAWQPYIEASARFIAPFQYPDGPVVVVQAENEYGPSSPQNPGRSEYMQTIEDTLRSNGVDRVPLQVCLPHVNSALLTRLGAVDLYTWDAYPGRYDCSHPDAWHEVITNYSAWHQHDDPDLVWATGEFQGGSLDPWGGAGYDGCYLLLNEQFANVFYKNNYASQVMYQNLYMVYGGTNWGNLATTGVYTSYDYGAAIREDRTLTPKYSELKLQALFLHASLDFQVATALSAGIIGNVYVTVMEAESGAGFYVVRQMMNNITTSTDFTLTVNTTNGSFTIPQLGGIITLAGRESKILVTNYSFGTSNLEYSTAEVMTWFTLDDTDHIVLYAPEGQYVEVALASAAGTVDILGTPLNQTVLDGSLVVSGSLSGISRVSVNNTTLFIVDKVTAYSFWNPRLLRSTDASIYDLAPDVPSVLIVGPYLVRNATIEDGTLVLFGDINTTTTLRILAPSDVSQFKWNDKEVRLELDELGFLSGSLPFDIEAPHLPRLGHTTWLCVDSLPEIRPDFDDSEWVTANETVARRPEQMWYGKYVTFADEYGFHQGNSLYRGHFQGNTARGVNISMQGYAPLLLVPHDLTFSSCVVFPRGIRGYSLLDDDDFETWKIQGNLGGEDFPDKVRGPLNEGGLWVERIGAHLPGFFTAGWNSSAIEATCSPYVGLDGPGIVAYRTSFTLDLPTNIDVPLALNFTRTPTSHYLSMIYINGWQFGRFNSLIGPQTLFPLPQGILNHNGENELLITLWALSTMGAAIEGLELVATSLVSTSKEGFTHGVTTSPTFQEVRG